MNTSREQREAVQKIYNQDSDYYVTSAPHARSSSLARSAEVLNPSGGVHLDIATGAGHTAYQMAEGCRHVIASDLTAGMLDSARKLGAEKGVGNVSFLRTDAENIAVQTGALDSVSVRIAPHHFPDVQSSMREMFRVLKPGGRLVYIDNIAPEEPKEQESYNDFERLRDPSHNRCDSLPDLVEMLEAAGFRVLYSETLRKKMVFEDWVRRPHLTDADKASLRSYLETASPAIAYWLDPREEDGAFAFDEQEAVILAERPA